MRVLSRILFFLHLLLSLSYSSKVMIANWDGPIGPITYRYFEKAINKCKIDKIDLLIIKLDTPGGLLESTRRIVQLFLSSDIPISVYITPAGARAASAGVFITAASNWAVMCEGTHLGAAHPVSIGNNMKLDSSNVMSEKILNDAIAFMKNIAEKRNRNEKWLVSAVRESETLTEKEALSLNVIDQITDDLDSIIIALNNRELEVNGKICKLELLNPEKVFFEIDWWLAFLKLISDPNIAYIFMLLGMYGLIFELSNPGSILPGIVGVISLVIALYSFHTLPINIAGIILILFAVLLFILEVKVNTHGLLFIGGIISMFLGSFFLIDTELSFIKISLPVIIIGVGITALFFLLLVYLAIKAQKNKKKCGKEGMIGEFAKVVDRVTDKGGRVYIHGEYWNAISENNDIYEAGDMVEIININGMTLIVRKKEG